MGGDEATEDADCVASDDVTRYLSTTVDTGDAAPRPEELYPTRLSSMRQPVMTGLERTQWIPAPRSNGAASSSSRCGPISDTFSSVNSHPLQEDRI